MEQTRSTTRQRLTQIRDATPGASRRKHRAIAKETCRHRRQILQLVRQRQAHRNRQAAAHNRTAAKEAPRHIEEVHRAAVPVATAIGFAVQLRHQRAL